MSLPKGSPTARALAALQRVENGAHSDKLIQAELARQVQWGSGERGAFIARFRGVLEHSRDLDHRLGPRLKQRPRSGVYQALRLGLYLLDSGQPPHFVLDALLHELGEYGPAERGLVNGVLRAMLRAGETPRALPVPALERLPEWLSVALCHAPEVSGEQAAEALLAPYPLWFRVRQDRVSPLEALQRLDAEGLQPVADPYGAGFLQLGRLPEGGLPQVSGIREGWLLVQDLSTWGAVELLDAAPHNTVLDACAAPGNKTLALLDRWAEIRLCAVEADPGRSQALERRLDGQVPVHHGPLAGLARTPLWERILLDVPCSGSGSVVRRPEILLRNDSPAARGLADLQRELLDTAARLLMPGGLLVYSTCSVLDEENGQRIDEFLEHHPGFRVEATRVPERFRDARGGWSWRPWRTPQAGGAWAIALRSAP